jgi:Tfp pilus assembly protein PilF
LLAGRAALALENHEQARDHLLRAVAADPDSWKTLAVLGVVHNHLGHYERAFAIFERALGIAPDKGEILNNMGVTLAFMGEHERALERFEEAVSEGFREALVYNNIAVAHVALGDTESALASFRCAAPPHEALNNLGVCLLRSGEYEAARSCFQNALGEAPGYYATAEENLNKTELLQRSKAGLDHRSRKQALASEGPAATSE